MMFCPMWSTIPQGITAHQATDHRYYRRFKFFISVPMGRLWNQKQHYESCLRRPDAIVIISRIILEGGWLRQSHRYSLWNIVNQKIFGKTILSNHFQLEFTFPFFDGNVSHTIKQTRELLDFFHSTPKYIASFATAPINVSVFRGKGTRE